MKITFIIITILLTIEILIPWIIIKTCPASPAAKRLLAMIAKRSAALKLGLLKKLLSKVWMHMSSFVQSTPTPDTCGDHSGTLTLTGSEPIVIVSSLKDLPLYDFVDCYVNNNYKVLAISGNPDSEALEQAWTRLISMHYIARNDSHVSKYVELMAGMEEIKYHARYMEFLIDSIEKIYMPVLADRLREQHPQFELSADTYRADIENILLIERRANFDYGELKQQFDSLDQGTGSKATERQFIELLMDINQIEKSSYSLFAKLSHPGYIDTYTYSIAYERRERHIENLKTQAQR